jgi:hypothetical protein
VNPDARRGAVSFTALQLGQGALGAPHPQAWDRPMALGGGFSQTQPLSSHRGHFIGLPDNYRNFNIRVEKARLKLQRGPRQ